MDDEKIDGMSDEEFFEFLNDLRHCDPCRCPRLIEITPRLDRLFRKGDISGAEELGRFVGDMAGNGWGSYFRKYGVLKYVLEKIELTIPSHLGLAKQCLRIIGNCCAIDDEGRSKKMVTKSMNVLIPCLEHEALAATTISVLTNLYIDYEEQVEIRVAELRLEPILAEYLAKYVADHPVSDEEDGAENEHMNNRNKDLFEDNTVEEDALDLLVGIVEESLTPEQLHDSESFRTFNALLKTALACKGSLRIHDYARLIIRYLQEPVFQQKVVGLDILGPLIDFTLRYTTPPSPEYDNDVEKYARYKEEIMRALSTHQTEELDGRYEAMLHFVNALSAISASDEFVSRYDINSPELDMAKLKLRSKDRDPATVLACVMLGNLATSDEASISMVKDMDLHLPLLDILSGNEVPALIYPAAGFIRHLAFPEANRHVLAKAGLIDICCRLLSQSDPSVRGEAAAILGKLASNNLPNIKNIVCECPPEVIAAPQSSGAGTTTNETILHYLVTQALAPSSPVPSTSMKNAMVEIGRAIVAIMRYISQGSDHQDLALRVFKTPLVARPVARLVRQRFFADARSDGLLGLGLMAQSREGAECVVEELRADKGLLEAVKESADPQDSGKGQHTAKLGRDRQNALVLLHALAKNGVAAMDATLKSDIDTLQAELGKLSLASPGSES